MKPTVVLIAGPTASGKSAVALGLAARTGGVVINADSMQVYRDLRILTARPSETETAQAEHVLYGHVPGEADYSVGRWLFEAETALASARQAGRLAIIIGGTGLYFRALTVGLSAIPAIPEAIRAQVRSDAEPLAAGALHAKLAAIDPVTAARLKVNDRQRIVRGLEVMAATGRSLTAWQAETGAPLLDPAHCARLVLDPERETLNRHIDARFDAMIEEGALDEVGALLARGLPQDRPILKSLGVPALARHLMGDTGLAEAVSAGQQDTRRYAKRQQTWFRTQMPDWPRAAPEVALDTLLQILKA